MTGLGTSHLIKKKKQSENEVQSGRFKHRCRGFVKHLIGLLIVLDPFLSLSVSPKVLRNQVLLNTDLTNTRRSVLRFNLSSGRNNLLLCFYTLINMSNNKTFAYYS